MSRYYNNTIFITAGEDISRNDLISIVDSSGPKVVKADSENGKPAMGFAVYDIPSGRTGKVCVGSGMIYNLQDLNGDDLVLGQTYYTSGGSGPPDGKGKVSDASGTLVQFVGYPIGPNVLCFNPAEGS